MKTSKKSVVLSSVQYIIIFIGFALSYMFTYPQYDVSRVISSAFCVKRCFTVTADFWEMYSAFIFHIILPQRFFSRLFS